MRKVITIFMIVFLLSTAFVFPVHTDAKTLRQAYADLTALEKEANETAEQKKLTAEQIAKTEKEIKETLDEITQTEKNIVKLEREIEDLNDEITSKQTEIKDLSKYLQVSTGESAYLEYAFGSETITEFVYRMAVIEQLNEYNSNLVLEMEEAVQKAETKSTELENTKKNLKKKQNTYVAKLDLLGQTKTDLEEEYSDIKSDIKEAKVLLDFYEKAGCSLDQDLDDCVGKLPINASFKRPTTRGYITSNFGVRYLFGSSFHYGIDIGVSTGTPLYPIANGIVTSISGANNDATCGGLIMTIIYNINGKYYTSSYVHLSQTIAKVGDIVSVNEMVARSGNSGYCTTGAHLHFTMTEKARYVSAGLYGIPANQTYTSYTAYKNNAFDQRVSFGFGYVGASYYSRGYFTNMVVY